MRGVPRGVGTRDRFPRWNLTKPIIVCLLFFAVNHHPSYKLVVAANRDEYYRRATEPARFWAPALDVLAGRDLEQGGTWLGLTRRGRWAAVTNYREAGTQRYPRSRGHLVRDYLFGDLPPQAYVDKIEAEAEHYAGFNLIAADVSVVAYYSNRGVGPRTLADGVYGLSNHLLETPWPKLVRGKDRMLRLLEDGNKLDVQLLFELLGNREVATQELPETAVGEEFERLLSSAFITSPEYGTRSSTALLVDRQDRAMFVERSYRPSSVDAGTAELFHSSSHQFTIQRL